ncbi:hypothetical protein NLJ89_g8486 [Agrocybe chaxingu]|uniref:DUF6593 domain-containing protein n=1 Tax=Agrocybe chaxingu TaxID=84603 RepID=A0A9W8JVC6_9AGAR|nr:hypothetical protein NLJ89_g8486 [Agrocybe chaxingu]
MHLYLTSNSPWDTTYCTESGQVIYKAESRGLLGPRHITISKIQPARTIDFDADGKVPDEALRDAFTEIGMVEWHAVTYSKIRVGDGEEVSVKDFFRKEGWGSYGVKGYMGRGRVFTGHQKQSLLLIKHQYCKALVY